MKKVAIIMGSQSDFKIMKEAAKALRYFSISYDIEIVSAHRTPQKMYQFANQAKEKYSLIIAGAGGSAHLPGMVAALTPIPVIGVPIAHGSMKGIDSLLSIVQMPKGIPVATVAINGAYNAGLLAAKMLGVHHSSLQKKLIKYSSQQIKKVKGMNQAVAQLVSRLSAKQKRKQK